MINMEKEFESTALLRNVRISPRKARLVIDQIRDLPVNKALSLLDNTRRRSNPVVAGLVRSAVANAVSKDRNIDLDLLVIASARVDKARVLKRMRPRAMGRGAAILKKSSHIFIGLNLIN